MGAAAIIPAVIGGTQLVGNILGDRKATQRAQEATRRRDEAAAPMLQFAQQLQQGLGAGPQIGPGATGGMARVADFAAEQAARIAAARGGAAASTVGAAGVGQAAANVFSELARDVQRDWMQRAGLATNIFQTIAGLHQPGTQNQFRGNMDFSWLAALAPLFMQMQQGQQTPAA